MTNYDVGILQSRTISRSNYTLKANTPSHVFEFDMRQNGTINLHLHDISSGDDADLFLYRDNGNGYFDSRDERVAYSVRDGNKSETITHATTGGTYFAKVHQYSGGSDSTTSYDLDLSAAYSEGSGSSSNDGAGLKFNFTYEGNGWKRSKVSQQQMIAFEMAGRIWSHYLKDDITVNIHVDVSNELPKRVLGGAMPGFISEQYKTLRRNLAEDASSSHDNTAVANLHQSALNARVRLKASDGSWTKYRANNPSLSPTRANLKALDSSSFARNDSTLDGYILMNDFSHSPYRWHYDRYSWSGRNSDSLQSNEIDFLSVAIHEIGHVLGFVSGVDYQSSDWVELYTGALGNKQSKKNITDSRAGVASGLDLFRYAPPAGDSTGNGGRDLSLGGTPYFSIEGQGLSTNLKDFANGRSDNSWLKSRIRGGLDNYQASHWEHGSKGIMVPAIRRGQRNTISPTDLMAFDVIGYDRTDGFSLPDYASLYQSAQSAVSRYAPSRTNESRLDDVLAMIDASTLYEGRGSRRTTRRQELLDVFAQEALNSSFDEDTWQAYVESITVKEAGTAGADVMKGSIGGDRFRGMENDDILKGYEGDDLLKGNQGGDRILGGTGSDTLIGGNGNDILKGEAGDDLLKGGAGIDVMVGGEGADTFVIDNTAGFNVIRDFVVGEDQLSLADGIQVNIGQRNNHTTFTLINDGSNVLAVLRNVESEMIAERGEIWV